MPTLTWDKTGEREYETGVSKGVLYVQDNSGAYSKGVAWNGLIGVTEKPTGAEATALYADDIKYLNLISAEEFEASLECYMYPDEFKACNGELSIAKGVYVGQQNRKTFGMAYRTTIGNDVDGDDHGYKLHFIYGATASPSEKAYKTKNNNPEAITFNYSLKTTPVDVPGMKPTASLTIDSTEIKAEDLKKIEEAIYGTETVEAKLPLPSEIASMVTAEG